MCVLLGFSEFHPQEQMRISVQKRGDDRSLEHTRICE
jgi:hypothetical protein